MDLQLFRRRFDDAVTRDDLPAAAALLEENCDDVLASGGAMFAECVAAIPPRLQAFHPRMMLALAWRLIVQWHFGQVKDLMAAIRLRLADMERLDADGELIPRLHHALKHREMMLALAQDDMAAAEQLCRELIGSPYSADAYVRASLFTSLVHARREQFKLSDADQLDAHATDYLETYGVPSALYVHSAVASLTLFALGRTEAAEGRLADALETARQLEPGAGPSALSAIAALPLAEVLYERGAFHEARALVDDHLAHGHEMGHVDQLISGYLTSARLYRRAGDYAAAYDVLDQAKLFASRRGFRRLAAWALAEWLGMLLQQGRLGREREHSRVLRGTTLEQHLPKGPIDTAREAEALGWVRLAEAHCKLDDGVALAVAWSRRMHREGALRSRVRWNLVAIRLLLLAGESRRALRLTRETLAVAARPAFMASFLDEPAVMDFIRLHYANAGEELDRDAASFAARLVAAGDRGPRAIIPHDEGPASLGSLSPREIEVLTLAAAAWRRSDIAERLGLTEGTVKWYLQQIYQKLGVNRRALAVDKARRFGIIPTQAAM